MVMRTSIIFIFSILIFSISLSAQNGKTVIVKAGTKVQDYFSLQERYRYPDFIPGVVMFKNGKFSNINLNYNILYGEIEFVQSADTMAITKKKDIRNIAAQDTFFYDNGYIELLSEGKLRVGLKQYIRIKDVLKTGAFGTTARSVSVDSYSSVSANGITYNLVPNEDIELEKMMEYYLMPSSGEFIPFTKKNVMQLFPQDEDKIKAYIKTNKVNFDSRDSLLKFADYLNGL
jgi:hypothetical protein